MFSTEIELLQQLAEKTRQLDEAVQSLYYNGKAYAEAERDYKIVLRQECLKVRAAGMPVGLIEKTCYGIPEVADKRFERDCKEALYKANLEAINSFKLQMRLLEGQLQREWGANS